MKNRIKHAYCSATEKPLSLVDWILFFVLAGFCFLSFQQSDLMHTGGSSIAYLNGHFLDFYEYNLPFMRVNNYLPSSYILFAIWNLPIYLLGLVKLPGRSFSFFVTMWFKTLPALFYLFSALVLYKIGLQMQLGNKKSKLMSYIFLTTPLAFFSQYIFGQYDILTVFFVLLGVLAAFKDQRIKSAVCFGVAVTFKYFALLIFIPLLLLREKNILKIIRNCVICGLPFVLETLVYIGSSAFRNGVFGFGNLGFAFATSLDTSATKISIVVVLFLLVSAWAYFTEVDSQTDFTKWAVYFCNLIVFLTFGLCMWEPQWLLFGVPFMVMGTMINKNFYVFLVLDMLFMLLVTVFTVNQWGNHVDQQLLAQGVFKKLLDDRLGATVTMRGLFKIQNNNLLFSCVTGLFLINAVFKHPKFSVEKLDESVDKYWNLVRARFLVGVAIWVIPAFLCMFASFSAPHYIVNQTRSMQGNIGDVTVGRTIEQEFVATRGTVSRVQLVAGTYARSNNSTLTLSLVDPADGSVLFTQDYSVSGFHDNTVTDLKFDAVSVDVGKAYKIALSTPDAESGNAVVLYHTAPGTATETEYAVIDGEKADYSLSFGVLGK